MYDLKVTNPFAGGSVDDFDPWEMVIEYPSEPLAHWNTTTPISIWCGTVTRITTIVDLQYILLYVLRVMLNESLRHGIL